MLTKYSLSELRRVVKEVRGNTKASSDESIISCANTYFPNSEFISLANELLIIGKDCGHPWNVSRWKFTQRSQDKSVFYIRYKANNIVSHIVSKSSGRRYLIQGEMLFQRSFTWEEGQLIANHDYLVLPRKLQRKGMSRLFNKAMYTFYKMAKVNIVKVYAGFSAGGYAWATAGFYATKKSELYTIVTKNREKTARSEPNALPFSLIDEFQAMVDGHYKKYPNRNFPMFRWAEYEEGEMFLRNSDWHGELNLASRKQRSIFETYLNKQS